MKIKQYLNIFFIIYNMGYMGYADDLDRFIKGQIEVDDIRGCICRGIPIQNAITSALQEASYYSQEEHDLYEKLCYAEVLYSMTFDNGAELYAIYLFAKNGCFPHKLDWDSLLEKIKRESGMNDADIIEGTDMYEECKKKGGCYGDLPNSLPSYYNSYVY
jgi:hypothetical protein